MLSVILTSDLVVVFLLIQGTNIVCGLGRTLLLTLILLALVKVAFDAVRSIGKSADVRRILTAILQSEHQAVMHNCVVL